MNDFSSTQHTGCGREHDLVAYLYGEADEHAAADFKHHLSSCAKCADETEAFQFVRADLAAWREIAPQVATLPFSYQARPARSLRQARVALAEFFRVSPRWMQAGGAFAALALCALTAFSFLNAKTPHDDVASASQSSLTNNEDVNKSPAALSPTAIALTQNELDNLVEREVARRLDEQQRKEISAKETSAGRTITAAMRNASSASSIASSSEKASAPSRVTPRRAVPAANRSRRAVSEDAEDEDLPSLSDLLYGAD